MTELTDRKTGFTILIIDDEAAIRELLEFDLKGKGYAVFTASNGLEGMEFIKNTPVDLIITDLRMPEMGGTKVLDGIRKMFKGFIPPVIVITGHFGLSIEEALAAGACQLMNKPFSRKDILKNTEYALKPLKERWSIDPANYATDLKIDVEIDDFDKIQAEGQLVFGWGGFFIHTPELVPDDGQYISFRFEIKKPENFILEGGGKVVWRRTKPINQLLPGVGIEIGYFNPACMENAIKCVTAPDIHSYIPNKGRNAIANPK